MGDSITSTLVFDLRVHTEDVGPYWLAFEAQLGILVFADTEVAAKDRLKDTITLVIDDLAQYGHGRIRNYLNRHDVHPTLVERAPWAFGDIIAAEEPHFSDVR